MKTPETPRVTIITPTYNREDYICETIDSVLAQTYSNIEYIILDDGSKDNTKKVIEKYKDKFVYYYHDNIGETATVNKGFKLAAGDIICVLNSDDPFFTNDAVELSVKALVDNPDKLMVYPDWVEIDTHGRVIKEHKLPEYNLGNMLKDVSVTIGPGVFFKKAAFDVIGLRDQSLKYTGDLDMTFKFAALDGMVHLPLFTATHRVHGKSESALSKGADMAKEVMRFCYQYIDHPESSISSNEKAKIFAQWYFSVTHFLKYPRDKIEFYKKSFMISPQYFLLFILKRFYQFGCHSFSKIFK